MAIEKFPNAESEREFAPKQWVIESVPAEADRIAQEVAHQLEQLGWTEKEMGQIELVAAELVANGIKHGNKGDVEKKVIIDMKIEKKPGEADEAILTVTDEGSGFDKDKIPDPTSGEGLYKGSGRGLFLAGMSMDAVEVFPGQGKISVTKKRQEENDRIK